MVVLSFTTNLQAESNLSPIVITTAHTEKNYSTLALELALTKLDDKPKVSIQHVPRRKFNLTRTAKLMAQNQFVDVMAMPASTPEKDNLIAIKIPIRFGAQGLRIALTHKSKLEKFNDYFTANSLGNLRAGYVSGWEDANIFKENKLPVFFSAVPGSLYPLLEKDKVDYFLRSIHEITDNYNKVSARLPSIVVEPNHLFVYPYQVYFFVAPGEPEKAKLIALGLQRAVADGSLLELFLQRYADRLNALNLDQRKIIPLVNSRVPTPTAANSVSNWLVEQLELYKVRTAKRSAVPNLQLETN